jgi:hypothetical protein
MSGTSTLGVSTRRPPVKQPLPPNVVLAQNPLAQTEKPPMTLKPASHTKKPMLQSQKLKTNDPSLRLLDNLMSDFYLLNNQLEESIGQQIESIKKKQVQIINEKDETSMRQTGKLAFARLKVELSVEDVDYNA